jgi:hypothetical protein
MNTTKILGEAVGIQRQDIIDRTEEQIAEGLTGAVILGRFKRGRMDVPMSIHQGNIRGQLGYDPKNPDYIAVQDCLDTGVPSVQVLRVKGGDESGNSSSHELYISPDLQYSDEESENEIHWAIEVNGTLFPTEIGNGEYSYLEDYLQENKETLGITGEYKSESDEGENDSSVYIYNITNTRKFVRLIPDKPYKSEMKLIGNPTAKIDSDGIISFWLEPNNEVQIPNPEPEPEPEPENWDIKYKVNGQWIYETTGPIVEISNDRNNAYRNSATELVFNNTVTEVGYGAFSFWVSLTKLTLGENITAIRARAFSSLKSVLELTIPDSVEFIGNEAFRNAEKVKNITLGTGVTTIESYAFTDSYVLNAFIMTGLTPPLVIQYPMLIMSSGSNGYTTGVIFVPDEAYDAYVAAQLPRLRRLSALSTYDFTEPYHWIN